MMLHKKKRSHYITSNSSIFEVFRVQFTLKSGSGGTPIGFYILEKSIFSLFFRHWWPHSSGTTGRKRMIFWWLLIAYVSSTPLWVWFVGSTYFCMGGGEKFFSTGTIFFVLDKVPLRGTQLCRIVILLVLKVNRALIA